jgi:AcrR family transcriptional regulator
VASLRRDEDHERRRGTRLGKGGCLRVSLEEVARDVGVSKPALYFHFLEGNEELFVAIAHRALEQYRAELAAAFFGSLYAPIHGVISSDVKPAEFRESGNSTPHS